jgi:hypothetical protein
MSLDDRSRHRHRYPTPISPMASCARESCRSLFRHWANSTSCMSSCFQRHRKSRSIIAIAALTPAKPATSAITIGPADEIVDFYGSAPASIFSERPRRAEFHSSRYRSSDLNLAAGCERIVFRPLQDRVEPSTPDADVASAKERERERILQQTSQRESMIIAFHSHDPHEIR